MTRDEYLTELQRRIAERRGYTRVEPSRLTGRLCGWRTGDEDSIYVPRWPQDWADAGELVEEMGGGVEGFMGCEWEDYGAAARLDRHYFNVFHSQGVPFRGSGATFEEAASRCWLAWKGVDLSDLPSVA